jgi:putative endonuclease
VKTAKRTIGDKGEEVACAYLEKKGDKVLQRNYWKPWGEIDIVAERGNKLVFVEVKSVSCESVSDISRGTVRPEENMHFSKVQRLHRAIQTYLLDHKVNEDKEWQIDLACVYLDQVRKEAKVELIENIVL